MPLNSTARSFAMSQSLKHERQLENLENDMAQTSARIDHLHSSRRANAQAHATMHRERAARHAEQKLQQDEEKADTYQHARDETQRRLDRLSADHAHRQRQMEKDLHDEFQLKSNLETLRWEASVAKANPDRVREGLGSIKAPIPARV